MDFSQSHHKHPQPKRKKRLTQEQVSLLETSFNPDKKLEPALKMQLARDLDLPPRQVAIWYQNKRARWKTQSLEHDYKVLQLKLNSALADKRRLEREVGVLKADLVKAQEMLLGLNHLQPPSRSLSLSCDEDGSTTLPNNLNYCWENAGAYQVEEFYACLMGAEAQTGN